jgi:PASTA domain
VSTRRTAIITGVSLVLAILPGCFSGMNPTGTGKPASSLSVLSDLVSTPHCGARRAAPAVVALTASGTVEELDPTTLGVVARLATSASPRLGIAMRPELDLAYVTASGSDREPAVWAVPIEGCRSRPVIVEPDAELPSVSPDGNDLGFVTLDSRGRQTGIGVVALGPGGRPAGETRRYRAASTPPALPIRGLAVGRSDSSVAVWGGFVDPYLGSKRVTVGTLDPATATSLAGLNPVFDAEGVSVPIVRPGENERPEDWQSSPVYLPNGEFLVNDHTSSITMPFMDTTPGVEGGGFREIVRHVGRLASLAVGEKGSVVFVGTNGKLTMAVAAIDLPFGPGATYPPTAAPKERTSSGHFTAAAWTEGPSAEDTPLPPVFHTIAHLPSVVGFSEAEATAVLNNLGLPVDVSRTSADSTPAAGTVLSQNPPAGFGVDCQCEIGLRVS